MADSVLSPLCQAQFLVLDTKRLRIYGDGNFSTALIYPHPISVTSFFLHIIHTSTRPQNQKNHEDQRTSRFRLQQHIFLSKRVTLTIDMSRHNTQMSSGRSRGSSLNYSGHGGVSYTKETTTINTIDRSGKVTHYRNEKEHVRSGSSSAHKPSQMHSSSSRAQRPLRAISEDDYDSDSSTSSDDTIVGNFSNMRLGGRTDSESTIRGPRIMELSDGHVNRLTSNSHSSRASSRPSESHYLSSSRRPTDSHHGSSHVSSRSSGSHYSSSRPSESHRRSTMSSSRPSDSHTYGAGKEVAVYEKPSDKGKSSRRESKVSKGIQHMVKYF